MSETAQLLSRARDVLIANYARQDVVMARGEGSFVWDSDGKKYLDLFAGFGGCILGHSHPALVKAASDQAQKLWHVGNTYHSLPQIELGERLNKYAFKGQAFYCHSGLESNEAACKLARLRGQTANPKKWKIISLNKSFHGRSLAMISATGNPATKAGFDPAVPGFVQVEPGDFDALAKAVDDETAGIIIEPIQGEGGINLYPADYAAKVRKLCDEKQITLIFDEVWTCMGRTGKWFGHQHFKDEKGNTVLPDIMTMGKAIGGGLPVGVMFARPEVAKILVAGKHGCTLGGNPICMAVARTIFDVIEKENLNAHAAELGEWGMAKLRSDAKIKDKIVEVRGRGLMIGVELKTAPEKFLDKSLALGVVTNLTASKVIRLAPPINIAKADWEKGVDLTIELIASL